MNNTEASYYADASEEESRFPENTEKTNIVSSKEEKMNDLIMELTGVEGGSLEKIIPIMVKDQNEVLEQHGYPQFELRFQNPVKYKENLMLIAKENDIAIGASEGPFSYYDDGTIFLKDLESVEDKALKALVHELTHALDEKNYPDLTSTQHEYRAYLADLGDVKRVAEALGDDFKEFFFGSLGVMGSLYFQERDTAENKD